MYTDTPLRLVLQETEFSVHTVKQEQGTMLLSLPVWCCKRNYIEGRVIAGQRREVSSATSASAFVSCCSCWQPMAVKCCALPQLCSVERLEPIIRHKNVPSPSALF